jgi:hypothetical protein
MRILIRANPRASIVFMLNIISETLPHLQALQAICFHHLNTHRRKNATLGKCMLFKGKSQEGDTSRPKLNQISTYCTCVGTFVKINNYSWDL